MIPNNNLSILPFYNDVSKQNHRKDYAFGEIYPLYNPSNKILPFQIIKTTRVGSISRVYIRKIDGTIYADITDKMIETGLKINRYESYGYDIMQYNGDLPLSINFPEGFYYLQISDGTEWFYSEIFNVVHNLENCLKITYWDAESLLFDNGRLDYTNNFRFTVYLPTQLGRPDYEFEEQVENRDGYNFIEKQISEKTYKFNFLAPEYLCDAMRIIRMSDNVIVENKGDEYDVDTFLITPKWQDGGYLASVESEFQCNTVIKKIGQGYTPTDLGDFNDDFNNDYKIT